LKTLVSLGATLVLLLAIASSIQIASAQGDLYTPKPSEPSEEPRKEPVKPPAPKPAEDSPFLGRWVLTANCIGIDYEEILTITAADANTVLGATRMMFNSAQIVGGSAKGDKATLIQEWDGKRARWTVRLTNGGQRMDGTVDGINIDDHHCTLYGGRG
jgi:hypothetical protein